MAIGEGGERNATHRAQEHSEAGQDRVINLGGMPRSADNPYPFRKLNSTPIANSRSMQGQSGLAGKVAGYSSSTTSTFYKPTLCTTNPIR